MDSPALSNQRTTGRVSSSTATVMIHGLSKEAIPAIVLDESFGGLGVAAPLHFDSGTEVDIELSVEMGGIRSVALVRHCTALPSGCRLGLEWKAQALSRCLRDLLAVGSSAQKHQSLVRILPGGLSVMWKLFEAGKWAHLVDSADRLRKEAAACRVNELSAPIEQFQAGVLAAIDANDSENASIAIKTELNKLITKCIETIS